MNGLVVVEQTYNMSQVLAMNQAWQSNVYAVGIWMIVAGFVIGAVSFGIVAPYVRKKYGSSK